VALEGNIGYTLLAQVELGTSTMAICNGRCKKGRHGLKGSREGGRRGIKLRIRGWEIKFIIIVKSMLTVCNWTIPIGTRSAL